MRRSGIILLLILSLTGCIKRPKGVLSDKQMAPVIADLELAEAYMQTKRSAGTSEKEALTEYVLEKHGVSRAVFDSTMSWYGRNIDNYQDLYKEVDKIIEMRRSEIAGVPLEEIDNTETDLWTYSRHAMISRNSSADALSFSIPSINMEKGERVEWHLRLRGSAQGFALLGVEYEDGERAYVNSSVRSSRKLNIKLQTDTTRRVSRLFGNLWFDSSTSLPVWVDSISLIRLPFDSLEYYNVHAQRGLLPLKSK